MLLRLLKYYLSLHYWDHASVDAIKRMQLKKFRKIFEDARKHSEFYHDLYTMHGVMNLKIDSWEDIQKVPVVTKVMLRDYATEDIMTCKIHPGINIHSTSGSSGEPFRVAYSKYEDYTSHVRLTKTIMQYGYTPFKKLVMLSRYEPGHQFEVEEDIGLIASLQKRLNLFPKEVISIFEPVDDIIRKLERIKPFIVWSTPSFIHILSLELKKRKQKLNIPLCFLMAETISEEQIEMFRELFCKDIVDAYGSMEAPFSGYSLNSVDYKNIIPNSTMAEVINHRDFNGQKVGDILITSLINKTMPIIRYNLGDYVGVLDDKEFPNKKIGKIYGRFDDIITIGDEFFLAFHQTYQLFHGFHDVEQYKFVQFPDNRIVLQLKIRQDADKAEVKAKALHLWEKYFPGHPLDIEWVDKFEIDKKTGKFKVLEKVKI
jgi:phenylacetate-CoA ligase